MACLFLIYFCELDYTLSIVLITHIFLDISTFMPNNCANDTHHIRQIQLNFNSGKNITRKI